MVPRVSRNLFRTNLKPQGGILGLSGGVFSGVMEMYFYAFFNGFGAKTGLWPMLTPRGPQTGHLNEISENILYDTHKFFLYFNYKINIQL